MTKPNLCEVAMNLRDKFQFSTENDKQWVVDKLTRSVAVEDDDIAPNEIPAAVANLMILLPEPDRQDLCDRLDAFAKACG